jgi:hypothetical protein
VSELTPLLNHLVPNGIPISQSLDLPADGTLTAKVIMGAVGALDRVIGDGVMAKIAVQIDNNGTDEGGHAWVRGVGTTELKVLRGIPFSGITILHEIGHRLDVEGLGQKQGYGSQSKNPLDQAFKATKGWKAAIRASGAYDLLNKLKINSSANHEHLKYLLASSELFARSFAQYIVLRSADPQLTAELEFMRNPANHPGVYYPYQWAHDDFEPIATAFDQMFYAMGWLRRRA